MAEFVKRPRATFAGSSNSGLLRNDHFEVCHVTNDIARARDIHRDQLGIGKPQALKGYLPEGGRIHTELAWVGGTMFELLTASGPGSEPHMGIPP